MSGITMSEAAAGLFRALGNEVAALREDYVGGRISVGELERSVEQALCALGHGETEDAD